MISSVKALVFFAVLVFGGAGAATAAPVEVDFGSFPLPSGCSTTVGDTGSVCANSQSFTAAGNTFTATGTEDFPTIGAGALTLKPMPANSFAESGLGENTTGPPAPCSSADCAIDSPKGIVVVASGNGINDVIVGSFDEGNSFNFFTGSSIAGLSFVDMFGGGGSGVCDASSVAGTCMITFPDAAAIGIQTNSGSVLLTAVSANAGAVPEPSTWAMLLLGFAGLGYAAMRRKSVRLVNV